MRQHWFRCRMSSYVLSMSRRGVHQRAPQISLSALASAFQEIGIGRDEVSGVVGGQKASTPNHAMQEDLSTLLLKHETRITHPRAPRAAPVTSFYPYGGMLRSTDGRTQGRQLRALTFTELLREIGECPSKRHFESSVLLLHELVYRFDVGAAIGELPLSALLPVLRVLASFGVGHLADRASAAGADAWDDEWVPKLIKIVHASIACQCTDYSFASNVEVLHLLCRCEDFVCNDVLDTLVDNILTAIRSGELGAAVATSTDDALSQDLTQFALLLDTIATQCDGVLPLCTKRTASSLGIHVAPPQGTTALGVDDGMPAETIHANVVALLHHVPHPIANQAVAELVLQHLTMILGAFVARGKAPLISPSSWFFLLRSLGKLPWISNSALAALFPLLRGVVSRDPSACKGVLFLLGRKDVTVTDGELVATVLEVLLGDLRTAKDSGKHLVQRDGDGARRLRYIELDKLSRFLPQAQHMLKVALESLLRGGGEHHDGNPSSTVPISTDSLARRVQLSAKNMYVALCDDQMASITSMNDLYHARLADVVLYQLVCLAPRALIDHPFVLHLVYAMTQLCPSLRFMTDVAKHRIVSTVERLQERGILNDRFQMPFATMQGHPLMIAALIETLEFKRRALIKRQSTQGSRLHVDPKLLVSYSEAPELVERNAGIAFVSFRKLMERLDSHGRT